MVKSHDRRRRWRRTAIFITMNGFLLERCRLSRMRVLPLVGALAIGALVGTTTRAEPPPAVEKDSPVQAPPVEGQPSTAAPVEVDPAVTLKGTVWRTKAGIVFLKTPVGLLTLSSKTTLKDLKASHEV